MNTPIDPIDIDPIDARIKEILKGKERDLPAAADFLVDKWLEPMLRHAYAMGWAHGEADLVEDYFSLEMRLNDPGQEWDYVKRLARTKLSNEHDINGKRGLLVERAQEIVEIMRTRHETVREALHTLPPVEGGVVGRLEAIAEVSKGRLAALKAFRKKTAKKGSKRSSP